MDKNKKQQAGNNNAQARTTIIPASTCLLRRLAFKIRKRGFVVHNDTSLLISNCFGVWSLRRRRYVRKTRFLRFILLKAKALPVERRYAALRKVGMHSWPEYDEQVAFWRSRLVDIYWDAAPAWYKEKVVDYFRAARRWRLRREWWEARFVIAPVSALMLAVASFRLVKAVFSGERVNLLLFTVFYILGAILWRIMLFKPNASALKMLEASMGSGARRSNMYPIGRSGAKRSSGAPGGGCTGGGRVGPDAQSCWPCPHASATSGASRRHRAASASSSSCCPLSPQARAAFCVLKLVLPLHNKIQPQFSHLMMCDQVTKDG
ncbi:unnamed protein product [Miscanthus lutarioriparius]|uniref:Uncharacterized protein n=1 Tax=Miscanthus lutarioriparius TaxID=422564 RepID=A0A811PQ33_9POAL|nr:unnamed protein product [Miscanthus lutarioriparius]